MQIDDSCLREPLMSIQVYILFFAVMMYLGGQLTTQLCHKVFDQERSDRSFTSASVSIVKPAR